MAVINITRKLAEFVARTTYEDLPKAVVEAAKRMILDTVGCGIAGTFYSKKEVAPVQKVTEEIGGNEDCTLIVSGKKTSWFNAILVNGTFMHSIDYDDTRPGPITHTGAVVVPAILSMGEKLRSSGKDAILAAVIAYETVVRVGCSVMPSHYDFWHSTGTNGTFGGAAVAGKLLKLNIDEMEMALGIAADQASGLISCLKFGDLTKSLHSGLTAAKGVLSALLVKHGATGPRGILEIPEGYCKAYSKEPQVKKIVQGLGNSFDILNNCPKFYPSILGGHCIIEAVLKLVRTNDILPDDILKVIAKTFTIAVNKSSDREPRTPLAARMSIPYSIAAAIIDRELGMRQFEARRLQDRGIKAIQKKISLEADAEMDKFLPRMYPAKVEIITKDGKVFSAEEHYPKGFPDNPISARELERKFESLCATVFDQTRINKLKHMINHLESLEDISEIIQLLANR
jgi:2-methylcitrate dehydratase PrpD